MLHLNPHVVACSYFPVFPPPLGAQLDTALAAASKHCTSPAFMVENLSCQLKSRRRQQAATWQRRPGPTEVPWRRRRQEAAWRRQPGPTEAPARSVVHLRLIFEGSVTPDVRWWRCRYRRQHPRIFNVYLIVLCLRSSRPSARIAIARCGALTDALPPVPWSQSSASTSLQDPAQTTAASQKTTSTATPSGSGAPGTSLRRPQIST